MRGEPPEWEQCPGQRGCRELLAPSQVRAQQEVCNPQEDLAQPRWLLVSDFQLPGSEKRICRLKAPSLWYFAMLPKGTEPLLSSAVCASPASLFWEAYACFSP